MFDVYGEKVFPREGFTIPSIGDKIKTVSKVELLHQGSQRTVSGTRHLWDGFLLPNTMGTVVEIRSPGVPCVGYVDLVVHFKFDHPAYPYISGVVIPWDKAFDPSLYEILSTESNKT